MSGMKFKNPTKHVINLDAVGLDPVEPGQVLEVPFNICAPIRRDNGSRGKSALECCAPQLEPASEEDAKIWMQTPPPPTPVSKIVSIAAVKPPEAPGVKALREQREALALAQAKDPKQSDKAKG